MAGSAQDISVDDVASSDIAANTAVASDAAIAATAKDTVRFQPTIAPLARVAFFEMQTTALEAGVSADVAKSARSGSDKASLPLIEDQVVVKSQSLQQVWLRTELALLDAVNNRGRETHAFKAVREYLQELLQSDLTETEKLKWFHLAHEKLAKISGWDKPQWLKTDLTSWRDQPNRRISEYDLLCEKNGFTKAQMLLWDKWIERVGKTFTPVESDVDTMIAALDHYLHCRVSIDSVKNWLRRRPSEQFINQMFAAMAQNKIYINDPNIRIKTYRDATGRTRPVENKFGVWVFEGTDEALPVCQDAHGKFLPLPNDTDMIVFERRTIGGKQLIVPLAQPNKSAPNIQWFTNSAVKRGWEKEQRFLSGPESFHADELYGFFPDHYPMRITNSVENRVPTEKTGAALYGYARDHGGRQSRQLIVEYGIVMDGLKRNNSQLISDSRELFGLRK